MNNSAGCETMETNIPGKRQRFATIPTSNLLAHWITYQHLQVGQIAA